MTAVSRLQSRRVLVVARESGWAFSHWINVLQSSGADIHFFPLEWARLHPDLSNVTVHHLFAPLRLRLMLSLLRRAPKHLWQFPNYEAHLGRPYLIEFVYPLLHVELPGHPASPISHLLRRTGSVADVRPAALARVVRRIRPDLILSIGLDPAAAVTLGARDRFGPGFPTWLACAEGNVDAAQRAELPRILREVDYFAYHDEAARAKAGECGLTGPALPFTLVLPRKFDADLLESKRPLPPSKRRTIVIDSSCERPQCTVAALEALEGCAELLQNYMTIVCGPTHPTIDNVVKRILRTGRYPIKRWPQSSLHCAPELIGASRICIAMPHLSDEPDLALVYRAGMGAFPIQIADPGESSLPDLGLNGVSRAPAQADELKAAVTRALTEDDLVDGAAAAHLEVLRKRFSINAAGPGTQLRDLFDEIFVGPRAARAKASAA